LNIVLPLHGSMYTLKYYYFLINKSLIFIYVCVRLLLSLPVPIQKLQDMISDKSNGYDTSNLLYFLIWGPRTGSKIYYHFLKVNISNINNY